MATNRASNSIQSILIVAAMCAASLFMPALSQPSLPEKQPVSEDKSAGSEFDDTQSKAFFLVMNGKPEEAQELVAKAIKQESSSQKRLEMQYFLSALQSANGDQAGAKKNLGIVLAAQTTPQTEKQHLDRALILKRIGDCFWHERKGSEAIKYYCMALSECDALNEELPLKTSLLEALTGTYVYEKEYSKAEKYVKLLLAETEKRSASKRIEDIAALFWAKVQASNIYRHLDMPVERDKAWKSSAEMMDYLLSLRIKLDAISQWPQLEQMKQDFEERYIAEFKPGSPAEYLWLAQEFKMRSLPVIQWTNTDRAPRAALLCIHGLGLENRAFTMFGREMASRGYSVYALDVRGFGAWLSTQGQEDLQFSETIKDIGAVIKLIKNRENNLPVFLLGESMGGAIALRGAAAYPELLAGVISSVPSAELFQQQKLSLTVAYHLFQGGKNRPFRVGDMVTESATKNPELADKWRNDQKAKMDMTPKELIKFAVFMRTTKRECDLIKMPVLMMQGLKDRLVKPAGTFELFEALSQPDKDLLIIGTAEHLMFETFTPSALIMDTLCRWIDDHTNPEKVKATAN